MSRIERDSQIVLRIKDTNWTNVQSDLAHLQSRLNNLPLQIPLWFLSVHYQSLAVFKAIQQHALLQS